MKKAQTNMLRYPLFVLLGLAGMGMAFENMNGEYLITRTPNAPAGNFSTKWSEYSNEVGGVDYFEVYMGPITHLYGQVWWKELPEVALPDELVQKFDGKAMAIVGYEVDQVRKTAEGDVSVPINVAYNHHHDAYIIGEGSKMERVRYDPLDPSVSPMARADPNFRLLPVEHTPSLRGLPTSAHFANGNGGEYRKSYHGFPSPVAYVLESPKSVHVLPMQIDTWNRDKMNISGGSPFVSGPVPNRSLAPSGPGALYSGLLECPLTDRVQKNIEGGPGYNSTYAQAIFQCASNATRCAHTIATAQECFDAARQMSGIGKAKVETSEGESDTRAPGCTVTYNGTVVLAFFNAKTTEQCCGAGVSQITGTAQSFVDLELSVSDDTARITLTGPDGLWFGVGFFAQSMADLPYVVVVDGAGAVSERRLANHASGKLLAPTVTVASNTVHAGRRTVVLSRPARGVTPDHANFTMTDLQIPIINAIGTTSALVMHQNKTASSITLWPAGKDQPVCLCEHPAAPFGSAQGTLKYLPTGEAFGFTNFCEPEPRETILASRNPTCDVRSYVGGLQVCKHMWSLLDTDQPQPWPDQPITYYQKYRFYYQEYKSDFHSLGQWSGTWGIGAAGGLAEYDVPKCAPGTPAKDCTHMIWGVLTPQGDNLHIAAINFHCHAPTCLVIEMWNNHTGKLVCRQEPVYGGTGKIDLAKYDEPGYILTPPCLWGDEPLEPMPLASGVTFMIKAITNATYGHHGEMAFPEVTLVPWNTTTDKPLGGP